MTQKILQRFKKTSNLAIIAIVVVIGSVIFAFGTKPTLAPEETDYAPQTFTNPAQDDLKTETIGNPETQDNTEKPVDSTEQEQPVQNDKAGRQFQLSTDTDFSKADPNMPKTILDKIKDTYYKAKEKLANNPYDFGQNMEKASALYNVNEYEKSEIIYKKMGELRPDNFISFRALGGVYVQLKKYPEAEQAYLRAIKNASADLQSYMALADIYNYNLTGDRDKITKFYENGIKSLGANGYNLVKSYAAYLETIGEYAKSLEQWKIVSKAFPEDQAVKDKITELEGKIK